MCRARRARSYVESCGRAYVDPWSMTLILIGGLVYGRVREPRENRAAARCLQRKEQRQQRGRGARSAADARSAAETVGRRFCHRRRIRPSVSQYRVKTVVRYPATKILWSPDRTSRRDLLATTGDYLRVWSVPEVANEPVEMVALLNNNKNSEYCAPLTSFDWNESEPSIIGTSSIDTTCTIQCPTYF